MNHSSSKDENGRYGLWAMINVKSALDAWWKLASIFSGGMLGLFLLGLISKKKNAIGAVIGVIAGLIVIIWLSLSNILLEPVLYSLLDF